MIGLSSVYGGFPMLLPTRPPVFHDPPQEREAVGSSEKKSTWVDDYLTGLYKDIAILSVISLYHSRKSKSLYIYIYTHVYLR